MREEQTVKKSSRGRGAHLAERGEENREDDTGDGGGSSSTLGKRRQTWGRDRQPRPPPVAARISSRRASSIGLVSVGDPRRSTGVGRRAMEGSLLSFYPLLSRALNWVLHDARPIGTSARHAHPSPALLSHAAFPARSLAR